MNVAGVGMRVVVAACPVDFRKGHDALATVVEHKLGPDPYSGMAVVFRPQRMDRMKVFDTNASPLAKTGLERIAELHVIEKKIRSKPPAMRQAVRWTESTPLVNRFGAWLDEQRPRVSPRSRSVRSSPASPTSGTGCWCSCTTGAWRWTRLRGEPDPAGR